MKSAKLRLVFLSFVLVGTLLAMPSIAFGANQSGASLQAGETGGTVSAQASNRIDPTKICLDKEGYLWRCNADGKRISRAWPYGYSDANYMVQRATMLFISSDVTTISDSANIKYWDSWYGKYETRTIDFSNLDNVRVIQFNPNAYTGTNACRKINSYAFDGMQRLNYVKYFNKTNISSFGRSAFNDDSLLSSINFPSTLQEIGEYAFQGCTNMTSAANLNKTKLGVINNRTFQGCTYLKAVALPSSVTMIDDYAFGDCTNLRFASVGKGITKIGNGAFYWCTNLASADLPSSLKQIESNAYYHCSSLKSVTLRSPYVVSLGYYSVFGSTPMEDSSQSSFKVPSSLVSSYKLNSDWSKYASKIKALGYPITSSAVSFSISARTYTGSPIKATMHSATYNGAKIYAGRDYKIVGYRYNTKAGKAYAIVSGVGKFSGTRWVPFTIKKASIYSVSFRISDKEQMSWGQPVKATMSSATYKGKKVYANRDYKIVGYRYNDSPGTAYALVSGVGNFYGSKRWVPFTIYW